MDIGGISSPSQLCQVIRCARPLFLRRHLLKKEGRVGSLREMYAVDRFDLITLWTWTDRNGPPMYNGMV